MLEKLKEYLAKYGALAIFVLIALAVISFFIMRSNVIKWKNQAAVEKEEKLRFQNNIEAANDTIKVFRDQNGNLTAEVQAYKVKVSELNDKYKNLFNLYLKEKNKQPIYIVEYRTQLDEKITNISTLVSDTAITFLDSVKYTNGNYRTISGKIPYKLTYHIKKDMVNKFAFQQALYYAYVLEENGCQNPEVVAFKDNKKISIKEALKEKDPKGIIYRVRILETTEKLSLKQVSDRYKVDEKLLVMSFSEDTYRYYIGNIVPFQNLEPMVQDTDIDTYAKLFTSKASINFSQGMNIYTGLYNDTKTGRPMISVKTDYPGLSFNNIVGADILSDKTSRKVARDMRQEFGLGLNLGYGGFIYRNKTTGVFELKHGPEISVGLNWTPRWAQFNYIKKPKE